MKFRLNKSNLFSTILFVLSGLILIGTIMFTMTVQVLKDWQLILPEGEIHAGDTITVQSVYTKLKPVTGTATRYLECKNPAGAFIRYEINQREADRAPGTRGTGVVMKLPTNTIPDLPATCKISINVRYQVYPWRAVTEFNSTKEFKLLSERAEGEIQGAIRTSRPQQAASLPASSAAVSDFGIPSSTNRTAEPQSSQQETSQVDNVAVDIALPSLAKVQLGSPS